MDRDRDKDIDMDRDKDRNTDRDKDMGRDRDMDRGRDMDRDRDMDTGRDMGRDRRGAARILVLLLISFILFACGFKPLIRLNYGVLLDRNGVENLASAEKHNNVLDVFFNEASKLAGKGYVLDSLFKTTIQWWDHLAPSPSTGKLETVVTYNGKLYAGLNFEGGLCMVAWKGKFYQSALVHEVSHVLARDVFNDQDHYTRPIWGKEGLVTKVNVKLMDLDL